MADTAVAITAGTGTNIDTRTEGTNGNHRQVIVVGDPATNAGVAPVDATNGLAVQVIPALPAGTNAIGKLAANSGVDIGDVDVTSVPTDPFGANADAASATGSVSAKLRGIATALGVTALDLGSGTGGTRTLRTYVDPASQNANGRAAAADSTPTVLSTEDKTALDAAVTALQLIDDAIVADDAAFTPATTKVLMAGFQADEASTDSVTEGDGGAARMTLDRKIIVTQQPHTSGGLTPWVSLDLDETEEDIKTSPGQLYWYHVANRTTSPLYLRFYNATAANVTVGTTATFFGPFEIPANASDHTVEIANFGGNGVPFDTAISAAVTTGSAADNVGAPAADACIVNVLYK